MDSESRLPPGIQNVLDQLENSDIVSIEGVVTGIISIIGDPDATAKDLKEIIEIDPPLTARVLFLANSAYYAPKVKIVDIMQAIIFVGFDAIKELALNQKVAHIFKEDDAIGAYSMIALWKHCVATALFAKLIYRREFRERGDDAYTAGLLHDIGLIALQQFLPDDFRRILGAVADGGPSMTEAETRHLGFDHAALGEAIAGFMNFPEAMTKAIGAHHGVPASASRLTQTLILADCMTRRNNLGYGPCSGEEEKHYAACIDRLGIHEKAVQLIIADVNEEIARMEKRGLLNYEG
jgi:putative nucleotidyltransferase with HDIG domain